VRHWTERRERKPFHVWVMEVVKAVRAEIDRLRDNVLSSVDPELEPYRSALEEVFSLAQSLADASLIQSLLKYASDRLNRKSLSSHQIASAIVSAAVRMLCMGRWLINKLAQHGLIDDSLVKHLSSEVLRQRGVELHAICAERVAMAVERLSDGRARLPPEAKREVAELIRKLMFRGKDPATVASTFTYLLMDKLGMQRSRAAVAQLFAVTSSALHYVIKSSGEIDVKAREIARRLSATSQHER